MTFDIVSAGHAVVPQYYSVQAPWGLYPVAGLVQQQTPGQQTPQGAPLSAQQQQQLLRAQAGNRPITPSQSSDGLGTPTGGCFTIIVSIYGASLAIQTSYRSDEISSYDFGAKTDCKMLNTVSPESQRQTISEGVPVVPNGTGTP